MESSTRDARTLRNTRFEFKTDGKSPKFDHVKSKVSLAFSNGAGTVA